MAETRRPRLKKINPTGYCPTCWAAVRVWCPQCNDDIIPPHRLDHEFTYIYNCSHPRQDMVIAERQVHYRMPKHAGQEKLPL